MMSLRLTRQAQGCRIRLLDGTVVFPIHESSDCVEQATPLIFRESPWRGIGAQQGQVLVSIEPLLPAFRERFYVHEQSTRDDFAGQLIRSLVWLLPGIRLSQFRGDRTVNLLDSLEEPDPGSWMLVR